jgi:hypothetical protein
VLEKAVPSHVLQGCSLLAQDRWHPSPLVEGEVWRTRRSVALTDAIADPGHRTVSPERPNDRSP